jgi:hypothetical protein
MKLTIRSPIGTETTLNVPASGKLSPRQVYNCRRSLRCPPGLGGVIGEERPCRPPEAAGVEYEVMELPDGGALMTPVSVPVPQEVAATAAGR